MGTAVGVWVGGLVGPRVAVDCGVIGAREIVTVEVGVLALGGVNVGMLVVVGVVVNVGVFVGVRIDVGVLVAVGVFAETGSIDGVCVGVFPAVEVVVAVDV